MTRRPAYGQRHPSHYREGGLVPRMRRLGFGGWADYRAERRHRQRLAAREARTRLGVAAATAAS